MSGTSDRIDGWEVRDRPDGSFGVFADDKQVAGPFSARSEAVSAAIRLPRRDEPKLTVVPSAER